MLKKAQIGNCHNVLMRYCEQYFYVILNKWPLMLQKTDALYKTLNRIKSYYKNYN